MYFNSIKVQLELNYLHSDIIVQLHFNSIKVQLEPADTSGVQQVPDIFQFHKGTIRTYIAKVTPLK